MKRIPGKMLTRYVREVTYLGEMFVYQFRLDSKIAECGFPKSFIELFQLLKIKTRRTYLLMLYILCLVFLGYFEFFVYFKHL